jgi:hypothetical protein
MAAQIGDGGGIAIERVLRIALVAQRRSRGSPPSPSSSPARPPARPSHRPPRRSARCPRAAAPETGSDRSGSVRHPHCARGRGSSSARHQAWTKAFPPGRQKRTSLFLWVHALMIEGRVPTAADQRRAIANDSGALLRRRFHIVMAGLVPAIHGLSRGTKNVDARDKPGHDEFVAACR